MAVVALLSGLTLWQRAQVDRAHDGRVAAEARADAHARRGDSLAALVRVDTVRVRETVTRYRTARDTMRVTDTMTVREVVERADEVAESCSVVVRGCGALVAERDAEIADLRTGLEHAKREARGCRLLFLPCPVVTVGYGAVGAAGTVYHGPAAVVGVNVWGGK